MECQPPIPGAGVDPGNGPGPAFIIGWQPGPDSPHTIHEPSGLRHTWYQYFGAHIGSSVLKAVGASATAQTASAAISFVIIGQPLNRIGTAGRYFKCWSPRYARPLRHWVCRSASVGTAGQHVPGIRDVVVIPRRIAVRRLKGGGGRIPPALTAQCGAPSGWSN